MYSPKLGRFISRDPIDVEENPFRYVGDWPTNATDPSGLQQLEEPFYPNTGVSGDYYPPIIRGELMRLPPISEVPLDVEFRVDERKNVTTGAPGVAAPWYFPREPALDIQLKEIEIPITPDQARSLGVGPGIYIPEDVGIVPYDPTKVNVIGGGQQEFLDFAKKRLKEHVKKRTEPIRTEIKNWALSKIGRERIGEKGDCAPARGKGNTFRIKRVRVSPDLRKFFIDGDVKINFGVDVTW